jgi:hypothetical protein
MTRKLAIVLCAAALLSVVGNAVVLAGQFDNVQAVSVTATWLDANRLQVVPHIALDAEAGYAFTITLDHVRNGQVLQRLRTQEITSESIHQCTSCMAACSASCKVTWLELMSGLQGVCRPAGQGPCLNGLSICYCSVEASFFIIIMRDLIGDPLDGVDQLRLSVVPAAGQTDANPNDNVATILLPAPPQ